MPVSVLQYLIQALENLSSEKFKELQGTIRSYTRREDVCEIFLKIDPEKLQKKFKSEQSSLHFQARCLSGILTIELAVELIRWIQQIPPLPLSGDEKPCALSSLPDEKPCALSSLSDDPPS